MRAAVLTLMLIATPLAAQNDLPQIEPEVDFPVWGSPDERRAYFETERKRIEEERARIEAEAAALAAERAAAAEAARASENRSVVIPGVDYRPGRVLVCRTVPVRHPDPHPETARPGEGSPYFRTRTAATKERCRYVRRDRLYQRRDGLVLRLGPDGFSGRLRLSGPDGRLIIEAR